MKTHSRCLKSLVLFVGASVLVGNSCLAIAISPGSDVTAGLGNTAKAVVRISAGGFVGSGTVVDVEQFASGTSICILTADHVIRDAGGGGSQLYAPSQITTSFGNQGGGGASFVATAAATLFDLPLDGSSAVDMAMIHVFVPTSKVNLLPAGLAAVDLPNAAPVEYMEFLLNNREVQVPAFSGAAHRCEGVFETLNMITRMLLNKFINQSQPQYA